MIVPRWAGGGGWTVWIDGSAAPPEEKLAGEEALLRQVGERRLGGVVRVWVNEACLVLGRFEARRIERRYRLPERFHDEPVLVRSSGGTAVPHGRGDLNVTLCYPVAQVPTGPEPAYRLLLEGLQAALWNALGLEATEGSVPGSFCDGRFNLVVNGRKVAGTAQAQRRGAVLVHATLMAGGRGADRVRRVADFYRQVGEEGPWEPERVASLSELAGRRVTPASLVGPIVEAFGRRPWARAGAPDPHGER